VKQIKLIFLFIFCLSTVLAQESDSLLERYSSYPDDTSKVNLLYEKGFFFRNTNLPAAIKFSKACSQSAAATNNKFYLAKAFNLSGVLKSQTGLQQEALEDFKNALQLRIEIADTLSQAIILNNLGNVYSNMLENEQALICYEKSLRLARSVNNDRWVHGALFSLAELQTNLQLYKQAEGNFYTLISWAQEKNDYEILGMCYKNMSICKMKLGDLEAAEGYQMQALDIAEMKEDDIRSCDALIGLAEIFLSKKEYQSCFSNLQQAQAIAEKNKYEEGLINIWKINADYFSATEKFKEAFYYLQKHDSALAKINSVVPESFKDLWENNQKEIAAKPANKFSLKDNLFECLLIAGLFFLLIFILLNPKHEQKEKE